jgi:hypothetical protein
MARAEGGEAAGIVLGGVRESLLDVRRPAPELASWGDFGGCGVGGGGAGGGIRWIGRRSGGGYVEMEMLGSISDGEDLSSRSLQFKATGDVPGRLNVGIQVPYLSNVRHDENFPGGYDLETDGLGDLSLLISRKFGMEGNTSANLTIGLPTAEYKQLEQSYYYYPYDAQLGKGVTTASVTLERNLNRDWGLMIMGGGYNYNGGENEIGNLRGDTLTGYFYLGYRREFMVHSFGVNLSYGLDKDRNLGTVIEDQATVNTTLQYGLELSYFYRFPVLIAVARTFGEERSQDTTSVALGVVTSF